MSAVTVLELHEGVTRSDRPENEKRKVLGVLDSKSVIPVDAAIARRAGRTSGKLVSAGRRIDREDCIVAARTNRS